MATPETQAEVAQYFGEAPANQKACDIAAKGSCDQYHATEEDYADKIWYWTTPIAQCLDGRTDVECTDYKDVDRRLDRGQGLATQSLTQRRRTAGDWRRRESAGLRRVSAFLHRHAGIRCRRAAWRRRCCGSA